MSFGVNPNKDHIPRGVFRDDGEGSFSINQYLGQSDHVASETNHLYVDPKHVYTFMIHKDQRRPNARFIKDIAYEDDVNRKSSAAVENFYLMFQLLAQTCSYAMKLSNASKYNSNQENDQSNDGQDNISTAEIMQDDVSQNDQVYAFIEGIPSTNNKKEDAGCRLWVIVQKNANFGCDFPTLLGKVISGEDFEEKKKGRGPMRVAYPSFAENYKRLLIGNPAKYIHALYQTCYGKANKSEFNVAAEFTKKAFEKAHEVKGWGSPFNGNNIKYHLNVFDQPNLVETNAEPLASYWTKMKEENGWKRPEDDYRISSSELYPDIDSYYWDKNNYFKQVDGQLIFCPANKIRQYMFNLLADDVGAVNRLVYSQRANSKPRQASEGLCSKLLPVRYVELTLKPMKLQHDLAKEMQKLKIMANDTSPDVEDLDMDKMGRYKIGTPSNNFTMPRGTTVDTKNEQFLTFCLEDGLMEMLFRANAGTKLQEYVTKRDLILEDTIMHNNLKIQRLRDLYTKFSIANFREFTQEVNGKGNISFPLKSICQHIELDNPLISPFQFQRTPLNEKFDFLGCFIQEEFFVYEYVFCIAHNHKEFMHLKFVGFGGTTVYSLPYSLVLLGSGEVGKSFALDLLRLLKVNGTAQNCNTSSNLAHTISHSLNMVKLYHEMAVQNTLAGSDVASKQRIATMKAVSAAGYSQHERVYQDPFDGKWKKTVTLLIDCTPKIQATNEISWNGNDKATASRHCQEEYPKTELDENKGVHQKNAALEGKYYEEIRQQQINKAQFIDAVLGYMQWLINDVGILDDPVLFVFPYVHKHIMNTADAHLKQHISSRGIMRIKQLMNNAIKLEAWEILHSYPPPYKYFIFTLNDRKRKKTIRLSENDQNDIVQSLKGMSRQVKYSIDGIIYIINKVNAIAPNHFILQEEKNNELVTIGEWKFETKYKENPHGYTDEMPKDHIPLLGKYFGYSLKHILTDPIEQENWIRDLDSLLYDGTSAAFAAFSIGQSNFYSYTEHATLEAMVELARRKMCKTQQTYLEENEKKNYNYVWIGNSNGTQLYENVKDIISQNSMSQQGKCINLSETLYRSNLFAMIKQSVSTKKYRRPTRIRAVRTHNDQGQNVTKYIFPPEDECLTEQPVTLVGSNQQTLQSSFNQAPPTHGEMNEKSKYNVLRRVKSKGTQDWDYYFLVPYCRELHERDRQFDNTTIVGVMKSFTHKYSKEKHISTANGTIYQGKMYPEIGELLHLKPNDKLLVDKQPNVLTKTAAMNLGCDLSFATQKVTYIRHDLDDLACYQRQQRIFIVQSAKDEREITAALNSPQIKRANKLFLNQLAHEDYLLRNGTYNNPDWPNDALQQATQSLRHQPPPPQETINTNNAPVDLVFSTRRDNPVLDETEQEEERGIVADSYDYDDNSVHSYTENDLDELRRARIAALGSEEKTNEDSPRMMMMMNYSEDEANQEDTVHISELGETQIGTDAVRIRSSLVDDEAGEQKEGEHTQKRQRLQ